MAGTRISKDENQERVMQCYKMRFEHPNGCKLKEWLKYCDTHYSDKSQQQHTKYWADAGKIYEDTWKEKLNRQLDPAVNELIALLANEDPKVRHEAAKSIFKYTGQDIQKIQAEVKGDIKVDFGGTK